MLARLAFMKAKKRPNTLKNSVTAWGLLEQFLLVVERAPIDEVPLTWLSKPNLERLYQWLRDTPTKHARPRQRKLDVVAKYTAIIQNAWKWAHDERDDFIGKIPTPRIIHSDDMPSDARNPTEAPTWEQMDAAIAAAAEASSNGRRLPCWSVLPMAVMRSLGLRVSQVLGLKISDIRAADGGLELYFPGHLGKSRQERAGRIVPIAPAAAPLIALLTEGRKRDEFLIPPRHGRADRARALRPETVREAWKRAGVPEEVWRQRPDHAFRKGYTTCLTEDGADDKAVEFLVGHSLGLQGVYRARRGYRLEEAVAFMPPFSPKAWAAIEKAIAEALPERAAKAETTFDEVTR